MRYIFFAPGARRFRSSDDMAFASSSAPALGCNRAAVRAAFRARIAAKSFAARFDAPSVWPGWPDTTLVAGMGDAEADGGDMSGEPRDESSESATLLPLTLEPLSLVLV